MLKRSSVFKHQIYKKKIGIVLRQKINELRHDIAEEAERLGLDLSDENTLKEMRLISHPEVSEEMEELMGEKIDPKYLLSILWRISLDLETESDEDIIEYLFFASDLIGFVRGIIRSDQSQAICHSCIVKNYASQLGKYAANIVHDKPNGSRAKRAEIQKIWASGKYDNKDLCAEQECAALDISFSTARKALRNLPKPT